MRVIGWMVAVGCLVLASGAGAQINKCVQADGSVRFSDRPCPAGAQAKEVRIVKDTSSTPYVPDLDKPAPVPTQAAAAQQGGVVLPQEPNPRQISYKCEAQSGQVWYLHNKRCPKTARMQVGGGPGFRDAKVMGQVEVTETLVRRREACKAIEKVDADSRPGSSLDQKDTTQDKAMNRDHC